MSARDLVEDKDLRGDALSAQRFKMLADIAEELKERVVFPISFDVTLGIRNRLQKNCQDEQLHSLLRLDPLLCARLLRVANSAARRNKQPPVVDIDGALSSQNSEVVRRVATETATNQLLRSRLLADFSGWIELLWERSLNMAATAHVLAEKYTDIAPGQAMFAALCHDMSLYYMLYRAAQYPELCSRPASLKHLVISWHGGISEALLSSMALPQEIVEAASGERPSPLPPFPKTLGDIVHISNVLAVPLAEAPLDPSHATMSEQYSGDRAEILLFVRGLRARYA